MRANSQQEVMPDVLITDTNRKVGERVWDKDSPVHGSANDAKERWSVLARTLDDWHNERTKILLSTYSKKSTEANFSLNSNRKQTIFIGKQLSEMPYVTFPDMGPVVVNFINEAESNNRITDVNNHVHVRHF